MTTVFGHPGRRFGQLVEALILVLLGTLSGVAWSMLGLYLSSLIFTRNPPSAYAIKGLFLGVAVLVHGFLRSYAPRLFPGLILLAIVSAVTLLSTAKQVTKGAATQILYPILIAVGVNLVVNLLIFPEFSSSFLGQATIETLSDTAKSMEDAGRYFSHTEENEERHHSTEANGSKKRGEILEKERTSKLVHSQVDGSTTEERQSHGNNDEGGIGRLTRRATESIGQKVRKVAGLEEATAKDTETVEGSSMVPLSALTNAKKSLREKLTGCKAAQSECNFEIAFSVLPPRNLKTISTLSMTRLLANTVAIISTCESKFALVGEVVEDDSAQAPGQKEGERAEERETGDEVLATIELDLIKPRREIEFGDVRLLRFLLQRIAKPYAEVSPLISNAVDLIICCVAYTYVSICSFLGSQMPGSSL